MRKIFLIILLLLATSCQSKLKDELVILHRNDKVVLNLELQTRDSNNYYGELKITNISEDDLGVRLNNKGVLLICGNRMYDVKKNGGFLGIGAKIPFVYLRKNKILSVSSIVESKDILSYEESCELSVDNNAYEKIKVVDRSISKKVRSELAREFINGPGNNTYKGIVFTD